MATNAERQRAYRQRHLQDISDSMAARINVIVGAGTKAQLERLARHHGLSQRAMLERLLADAEREVSAAPGYFD